MAILNKDGSVYKLSGPNVIMQTQDKWGKYQLHNMKQRKIIHKNEILDNISDVATVSKLEPVSNPDPESEPEPISAPVPIPEPETSTKKQIPVKKTFIYCLPARIKNINDELYGESYEKTEYDKPFSLEGIIVRNSDMVFQFWSPVSLNLNSIIYPKTGDTRWWKIVNIEEKFEGYVAGCIPSNYCPSFG